MAVGKLPNSSLKDREAWRLAIPAGTGTVLPDKMPRMTAFHPRPNPKSEAQKPFYTDVVDELHHRLQLNKMHNRPNPRFQAWLKIGKLPLILPERPDKPFDSKVWRCYVSCDPIFSRDQKDVANLMANLFPITIPPPSCMKEQTLINFVSSGNFYIDNKDKEKAITQSAKELLQIKRLSMHGMSRKQSTKKNFKSIKRVPVPTRYASLEACVRGRSPEDIHQDYSKVISFCKTNDEVCLTTTPCSTPFPP
ncbi:testis-expressed protein 52-like [Callorhinchus milii]|uniref:testis-expressed protein 52-like n=1 Tax=Callorhinchus milii TaxID=7868 RepID=UPI001C3FF440|nr:testis-expressed protein 52-like [Callorhinchus milii]